MGRKLLILALVVASLAACRANLAPIYEVRDETVLSWSGKPAAPERVRSAILEALRARRWHLVGDSPGVLLASVGSGGHRATVRISYGETSYSIIHEESSDGLQYSEGADGPLIHRRYNHWVQRLDDTIRRQLSKR